MGAELNKGLPFRIAAIILGIIMIVSGSSYMIERALTHNGIDIVAHPGTSWLIFGIILLVGGIKGRLWMER